MENIPKYPLQWPETWKRTRNPVSSRFGSFNNKPSIAMASTFLAQEIRRLTNSDKFILSTNLKYKQDGLPYSNQREPSDQGVAVYFMMDKQETVLACDSFNRIGCNIYGIAKTIEAMRGIDRWGCSEMLRKAFTGFQALPQKGSGVPWWEYFGVPQSATEEDVRIRYRAKCMELHPDKGTPRELWDELQEMNKQAMAQFKKIV